MRLHEEKGREIVGRQVESEARTEEEGNQERQMTMAKLSNPSSYGKSNSSPKMTAKQPSGSVARKGTENTDRKAKTLKSLAAAKKTRNKLAR